MSDEMTPLDEKIEGMLGDRVVLKPLTRWNEAYKEFPRFVLEYLCSRYVDPNDPLRGQRKIDQILVEHYTESSKKELVKSRIKEQGHYTLLGQLSLRLDQAKDHYWADVPALGDSYVRIGARVLTKYSNILLTSGAWGTMVVEYDATYELEGRRGRKYPFLVRDFTPFQVTRLDLDDYIEKRRAFSDEEWLDLLVQSIGFNPNRFDPRTKLLMMLRLVPFVESNYNMIELGPRETGKTYTYRNTSSKSFVVSGGKATPATLFYRKPQNRVGILGIKQVVYFDEIANTKFDDAEASISVLKDYMQTGKFTRFETEFTSTCSVVLGGNIDSDTASKCPDVAGAHLFSPLPEELQDAAFLDRLHAYLPGWELPKIRPENYARGYGFLTDYLAEIFSEFRRRNYQTHVTAHVDLSDMTGRNQDATKKTTAGLLKLLHPHRSPDSLEREELTPLVEFAVEMRKCVTDQLAIMLPAEFGSAEYRYAMKDS